MQYGEDDMEIEPEEISEEAIPKTPKKKLRSLNLRRKKTKGRKTRTD